MLSFCSSPHGLVSEPAVTGTTRRQRRTSLPSTTPGFATVRRVATLGGKRSFSGGSRRGASTNLKALISQPKDFVHLTHVDGSSTTVSLRATFFAQTAPTTALGAVLSSPADSAVCFTRSFIRSIDSRPRGK